MVLTEKKMTRSIKIALVGFIINASCLLLAMIFYPNYNQFDLTISKLGTKWPSSLFFNIGMLIGAVTLLFLLFKIQGDIQDLFEEQIKEFQVIFFLYIVMILCIVGVVIFPSKGVTSVIHFLIALVLFILMAIATAWVSSLTKTVLSDWNAWISYLGYSCSTSVVILAFLLAFWEFGPFVQKITVLLFVIWVILTVYDIENIRKQALPKIGES